MDMLLSMEMWAAFFTLTALEIVLGIDNIIFISVLTGRLPVEQQARARFIGLALAMVLRIVLLLSLAFIMGLTSDLFAVAGNGISGRDIILAG
jgi:predicted tellurium resistance membrane protein TerC